VLIHAKRSGEGKAEAIIEKVVEFKGSYAKAHLVIGHRVGQATRCRTVQSSRRSTEILYLMGYESDVARAETLIASLMIQAQRGVNRFAPSIPPYYSAFEKFRERRSFLVGFGEEIGARMAAAERVAKREFVAERVAAGEDEGALKTSMSLALRSRQDNVNDWVDTRFGRLRSSRSRMGVTNSGYGQGRDAGSRADLGQSGVGPSGPRQLGK
jgi:hypothetical protein